MHWCDPQTVLFLQSLISFFGLFPFTFPHYMYSKFVRQPKSLQFSFKLPVKNGDCYIVYRVFMPGTVAIWTPVPKTSSKFICSAYIVTLKKTVNLKRSKLLLCMIQSMSNFYFVFNASYCSHCIEALERVLCWLMYAPSCVNASVPGGRNCVLNTAMQHDARVV